MRIVFMGTPYFAVPTLQALLNDTAHEVVAVYTQPPRPAGRGQKLTPSPVHQLAQSHGVEVRTPTSLKSTETQAEFAALNADIAIVVAYGLLLPHPILSGTRLGCINVHPSALPRWRGAAPIQRTIMAGDASTQIVIMQMEEGLDTGPALLRQDVTITHDMTAGELHDVCAERAAPMILQTLAGLANGTILPIPQATEGVCYAHKIEKAEARINWQRPAREILSHIHGLSPFPGAYFVFNGEAIKILKATHSDTQGPCATILTEAGHIGCIKGAILPLLIQRPGKKPMAMEEMLRGLNMPVGSVVE